MAMFKNQSKVLMITFRVVDLINLNLYMKKQKSLVKHKT